MVQECLILLVGNDDIETVVQLLSGLQLVLILGLTVTEDVEILPEGHHLVGRVGREVGPLHLQGDPLNRHFSIVFVLLTAVCLHFL